MGGFKNASSDLCALTEQQVAKFWSNVASGPDDACWPWMRKLDKDGYGQVSFGPRGVQRTYRAHRVALFLARGGDGVVALHGCDNPSCCNPGHLTWGTQKDNRVDCAAKGRTAKGERHGHRTKPERTLRGGAHPHAKLTDEQAAEIRSRYVRGNGAALAREFGVDRNVVHAIAVGRTYATRSEA